MANHVRDNAGGFLPVGGRRGDDGDGSACADGVWDGEAG